MKAIDLTGERFGRLVVIRFSHTNEAKKRLWECRCDCGKIHYASSSDLRSGHCKSCGCGQHIKSINDLRGQRFGRLTVIDLDSIEKANHGTRSVWKCLCDCGTVFVVRGSALTTGNTQSCGCLQKERSKETGQRNITHGGSHTRLYRIWHDMKNRCYREKDISYKHYGAKGVTICDEWLNDFGEFQKWALNNGYSQDLTLDRIDPSGSYEPSNCRWATWHEQNTNKRK